MRGDVVFALFVSVLPPSGMPRADQSGVASRFGDPGDKWIGGTLKCSPQEYVNTVDHICAHRKYSCGTILVVENRRTRKKTWCRVMDRGPYGANVFTAYGGKRIKVVASQASRRKYAWYVKKRRRHRPPKNLCPSDSCYGRWRGIVDLSPAVSDSIDHNGLERVRIWRLRRILNFLMTKGRRHDV